MLSVIYSFSLLQTKNLFLKRFLSSRGNKAQLQGEKTLFHFIEQNQIFLIIKNEYFLNYMLTYF